MTVGSESSNSDAAVDVAVGDDLVVGSEARWERWIDSFSSTSLVAMDEMIPNSLAFDFS